ncbi:hypothetical protein [Chitinimonas lacunae]|uniref:Flagellar hook-length control protein FliK n=1 Tax=Chitinimonas lacunae TaxID=1963018 RepID=A0ABV8MXW9_9NEIS
MRIESNPLDNGQQNAGERPASLHQGWLREMERAQLALLVELPGQEAEPSRQPADVRASMPTGDAAPARTVRPIWWESTTSTEPVQAQATVEAVESPVAPEAVRPMVVAQALMPSGEAVAAAPPMEAALPVEVSGPAATAAGSRAPAVASALAVTPDGQPAVAADVAGTSPGADAVAAELPVLPLAPLPPVEAESLALEATAGVSVAAMLAARAGEVAVRQPASNGSALAQPVLPATVEAPRAGRGVQSGRSEAPAAAAPQTPARTARPQWQRQWLHVSDNGEGVRVWLRDAALDQHAAQRVAYRLVAELGGGLRPVEVNINGRGHGRGRSERPTEPRAEHGNATVTVPQATVTGKH